MADFCTYRLYAVTVWVSGSARTSVTAVPMTMAMASLLKVFLMREKEGKGYSANQRRQKLREKRKRSGCKGRVN